MWEFPFKSNRSGYLENETHRECSNCHRIFLKRVPAFSSHKAWCPTCRSLFDKKRSLEKRMLARAKGRAKEYGIEFNIELEDIIIPEICPILDIPLAKSETGTIGPNSPTLDRMYNDKGYVKGNVWVISNLANSMKNSATMEQLQKFADWVNSDNMFNKGKQNED